MRMLTRPLILVGAALLIFGPLASAQTAIDPSGHWQGTLQAPDGAVSFEVDLARQTAKEFAGALTIPAQQIKGLPLSKVTVNGAAVTFQARSDQSFGGIVSSDGTAMSGQFTVGGAAIAFNLARTGEARVDAPPKSAPIARELEGTWKGTLMVEGMSLRLVLTMSNEPDGTATGRIVNVDQGGLQVPVAIKQDGGTITVDSRVIAGAFSGRLNASGTALIGIYSQGQRSAPLTLTREP